MIQFFKDEKSKYTWPDEKFQDAIFFATDTGELLVNNKNYGIDLEKVTDITSSGSTITVTMADGSTKNIEIGIDDQTAAAIEALKGLLDEEGNLNISLQYQTAAKAGEKTAYAIGGLPKGKDASWLKTLTLSQVFDEILFPVINPSKTDPSVSISVKGSNIKEVGDTGWTNTDFSVATNQGTLTINGSNIGDGKYAGAASTVITGLTDTVEAGTKTITVTATFAEGYNIPVDSKGNTATNITKYPGGTKTATTTVYGVYPFYATTTDANIENGTVTKLSLTKDTVFTCTLAAESATHTHVFKLPHLITKIELKDPFGNWVQQPLNEFPKTSETINVNSSDVVYNVYTRNQGQNGVTEFRITYSK